METKELKIDAAAAARETLAERQPGEDLDEALLRSCKKLYGDSGMTAFQALASALQMLAARSDGGREAALRQIAEGTSNIRIATTVHTTHNFTTGSTSGLPPDMRAEVDKALAAGKSKIVVAKTFNLRKKNGMNRCAGCGFEFRSDIFTCPQCGKTIPRSFWARLLGK